VPNNVAPWYEMADQTAMPVANFNPFITECRGLGSIPGFSAFFG
jgi:hypothetical protein